MKVLNLIKKDILLAGMYSVFSIMVLIAIPVFLSNQGSLNMSSVYILFMSVSFSCYFLFSNIFLMEDKYKGNLYLMAVPYKKSMIVAVKYVLGLLMVALEVVFYSILSRIPFHNSFLVKPALTFAAVSVTFLAIAVVLSIFLPLYFRFSYTKIKFALIVVMVLVPTWGMVALFSLIGKNLISEAIVLNMGISVLLILAGIAIMVLSAGISGRFLEKRNF